MKNPVFRQPKPAVKRPQAKVYTGVKSKLEIARAMAVTGK